MKMIFKSLKPLDYVLWGSSVILFVLTNVLLDSHNGLYTIAVIIGLTALIYTARGHVFGPLFMVIFSILYSLISLSMDYHSEFITYGSMTLPMSIVALYAWLKNPNKQNQNEVQTVILTHKEWIHGAFLTLVITTGFGIFMFWLNTPNLVVSTLSITTSFIAVYLTYKRSMFYALAYAANDIILIVLWAYAVRLDLAYLPILMCFGLFFIYDIYGLMSWSKMTKNQLRYSSKSV